MIFTKGGHRKGLRDMVGREPRVHGDAHLSVVALEELGRKRGQLDASTVTHILELAPGRELPSAPSDATNGERGHDDQDLRKEPHRRATTRRSASSHVPPTKKVPSSRRATQRAFASPRPPGPCTTAMWAP